MGRAEVQEEAVAERSDSGVADGTKADGLFISEGVVLGVVERKT